MIRYTLIALALFSALLVGASLPGCASRQTVVDPMGDVRNEGLAEPKRRQAIERVWSRVESGELDRLPIREDLKTIAWSPVWRPSLRVAALKALAADKTEQGMADTRSMFRLMLPREPEPTITAFLSRTAAERSWTEATPALVRSLSRHRPGTSDTQREEYAALVALNPEKSVEEITYALFRSPGFDPGRGGVATPERIRGDAWDLLARLDKDGSRRAQLILEGEAAGPVADMRALLRDMRTLPLTGEEIRWVTSLRDFNQAGRRAWWTSTTSAVAALDSQRTGRLHMRHLEPIRWASQHKPEWVVMSREELLGEAAARLKGRQFHRRSARSGERRVPDRLEEWRQHLSWGDLLTILLVDEAVQQSRVIEALFTQAERDRRDRNAEYGGLLRARTGQDGLGGPEFSAVLYPPRPGNRRGDHEFVAPTDMIDQSQHALAHYHFHVQEVRNSEYAGPSPADLAYAARFGRACLVFTRVGTGTLNVDYYQPDGVVVDMGTVGR
jgi:hypothetical protein